MICSNCGTENKPGRKFCARCASPLGLACPKCGAAYDPGDLFCGECASPLATDATAALATTKVPETAAAQSPVAERRLVSVLFADLVGFTTIAEGHDAEDTRELLNRYFELAREVIGRYGGTVEKFIGDAVMAVWGAPVAREDDAERAVRAGLELVDAVQSLGPQIQARAGVLTGEAAVTIGATNQGMVAGDLVNTASRLQGVAQPGTVLVGEATQRAASKAIVFEKAGEQHLKGKQAPVEAWRATRVVAEVGGRNRSDTLEAPFVGRDEELRLVKDLFHATTREGRARLVSVIGPAGFGKTRLAWEFLKYLDGLADTAWWHEGRSPAYGDGISFWALGEMIRARCGLLETDDEATTRAKVAEKVREVVADEQERRWIEPALLALLGVETGVAPEQLVGAWRTFFELLAATAPVVLVFEDFHNADSGLIDFVDHILEWSRAYPIYVVTLARPELLERRTDWGAGKRNFTSIYLEPLPEPAMRELLAGLVAGLPEAAVKAIVARADGIPLYAVETIRMLLAEGKLALKDDVYVPVGDLTSLAVPETLTALIAARLDGLPPEDRALILDAAVLGQSFTPAALAALSGQDEAAIEPRMHALVKRELLTVGSDPRSPERGQYAFVQALIREVGYGMLARRDRKTRHLAAARYFESLGSDELAGALAGHYLAAHQNAPEGPEADALAGQARVALGAAAQRAIGLGSYGQAEGLLEQALTVTVEPVDRASLMERAGIAATGAARYEAGEHHLRGALGIRRELGDRRAIATVSESLGRALMDGFRIPDAVGLLERAQEEFAELADEPPGIALAAALARAYGRSGDDAGALRICELVLPKAERAEMPEVIAEALITKGTSLGILGRPVEGLGAIAAGRELAESRGLSYSVLRALNNQAFIESARDPRAAYEISTAGLALARRLGERNEITGFASNLGFFGLRKADLAEALAELDALLAEDWASADRSWLLAPRIEIAAVSGEPTAERLAEMRGLRAGDADPQFAANTAWLEAFVAFVDGRFAEAARLYRQAESIYAGTAGFTLPEAGRAAVWARDPDGARAALASLDADGVNGPAISAGRRTVRAGIEALEGRPAAALAFYREALRGWQAAGLRWDEALTGIEMAMLLDPSDPEVARAVEVARETFGRLGSAPMLARLEAVLAGRVQAQGGLADGGREEGQDARAAEQAVVDVVPTGTLRS